MEKNDNIVFVIIYNHEILGIFDDFKIAMDHVDKISNFYIRNHARIIDIEKNKLRECGYT